ncbi:hypothetical protein MKQ70_25505 [Chitinophaga sedimenti]|uniref:hypothetical protein n=1 Tax=Chitinophaga sedimenti TaxID=2033606 RepID=UPI002005926B|nr:hypothetical protein [Chitinophaga sedimenti]MCK7558180.1 hypothetical protein [Chitinophaga sedimenti]
MMKTTGGLLLLVFAATQGYAQAFIRMTQPARESNAVTTPRQYLVGSTCKGCTLTLNDTTAVVYGTGAFALPVNLRQGANSYKLKAVGPDGKMVEKTINFTYSIPEPPQPVTNFSIANVETFPEGNQTVQPGDQIRIRMKAFPGCVAKVGETLLYEQPGGLPGIYQGVYTVKPNDPMITGAGLRATIRKDGQNEPSHQRHFHHGALHSADRKNSGRYAIPRVWPGRRSPRRRTYGRTGYRGVAECNRQSGQRLPGTAGEEPYCFYTCGTNGSNACRHLSAFLFNQQLAGLGR